MATTYIIEADFVRTVINAGEAWLLDTPANREAFAARCSLPGHSGGEITADTIHAWGRMLDGCSEALEIYNSRAGAERAHACMTVDAAGYFVERR